MVAVPTEIMAIGRVARLSSGASFKPTIPDKVMTRMVPDWNNACEKNSRITLFHFVFVIAIRKRYDRVGSLNKIKIEPYL